MATVGNGLLWVVTGGYRWLPVVTGGYEWIRGFFRVTAGGGAVASRSFDLLNSMIPCN